MNQLAEYYSDDESPLRRSSEEERGPNNSDKDGSFQILRTFFIAYTDILACLNYFCLLIIRFKLTLVKPPSLLFNRLFSLLYFLLNFESSVSEYVTFKCMTLAYYF